MMINKPPRRSRTIKWPVSTDEKAKARVFELRIEGGVSRYLQILVEDDYDDAHPEQSSSDEQ
jgi:hypothetical protein